MATSYTTVEGLDIKTVTIEVNEHKVDMPAGPATGLEVKEAAIKEGGQHSTELRAASPTTERIE